MAELANALRNRPIASDGTYYSPDIIIANEMNTDASLNGFRDDLNAVFGANRYAIVGSRSPAVKSKFLINTSTMTFQSFQTWTDVCDAATQYQLTRLREIATNKSVTVGGVHLRVNYNAPTAETETPTRSEGSWMARPAQSWVTSTNVQRSKNSSVIRLRLQAIALGMPR